MKFLKLLNGCKWYTLTMKIGTDIVQINRIEKALDKFGDAFKNKFLNESEIKRTKRVESLAGLWAAKEAISKALGCGIGKELSFHDITISKDEKGAPSFTLNTNAQRVHSIQNSSLHFLIG